MPGLSQLKQFTKDVLSLGDEVNLRAKRGEKPVLVPLSEDIPDINDSEDFVLGMPEENAAAAPEDNSDVDLSELNNVLGGGNSSKNEENNAAKPDLSSLLTPMSSDNGDEPDLSMFAEPEETKAVEEASVADMDLNTLLGGEGFDGSSGEGLENDILSSASESEKEFYTGGFGDENYNPSQKPESPSIDDFGVDSLPSFDTSFDNPDTTSSIPADDLGMDSLSDLNDSDSPADMAASSAIDLDLPDDFVSASDLATSDGLGMDTLDELNDTDPAVELATDSSIDLDLPDDLGQTADTPADDSALPDFGGLDLPDGLDQPADTPADDSTLPDFGGLDLPDGLDQPADTSSEEFSMDSLGDLGDLGSDSTPSATDTPADDSALPDLGGLDLPDGLDQPADTSSDGFNMDSLGDLGDLGSDSTIPDLGDTPSETTDSPELNEGFGSSFGAEDGLGSLDLDNITSDSPIDASIGISEEENASLGLGDFDSPSNDMENIEETPIEDFDTSEMEGIEFPVQDTDSQIGGGTDFELGTSNDFSPEGEEFEIPGFSDVTTAKEESRRSPLVSPNKKGKAKVEEELPPNTLSDAQYKKFLKNLSEYPLNVRLAFEDFMVKNEFTDDAEFEIIEKILNKAPARSVANALEKMLDVSIPVPRDFEHRTAAEYEAYKKSLQYQIKNKIVPGIFIAMVSLVVLFGLFEFGKHCVYIPLKANSIYKQGYTLLEADEYSQSEIKFKQATEYQLNKKWFFKYARGYRAHKQYLRAEWMYQNILNYFKHDKEAGLEYARMELDDLSNYEKAEEICRREILDYHINDKDGILLLGDVYLEWGTEKDPSKLEMAREQYATLIQLSKKPSLLYKSRMMRYFIRTDNLRNVLQLKDEFMGSEKNLSSDDWTELGGYLREKLYGNIAPADEYLRNEIEDVLLILKRAVKLNPKNPIATYNLSRYFIDTNESSAARDMLKVTIDNFKNSNILKMRDIYKYIDSYRLLGEQYSNMQEYLRAQEYYTEGISLYTTERDSSGFEGNEQIGLLFANQANIDYTISGDYENALVNYNEAVKLNHDTPSIRYRIGYIHYKNKDYDQALGSFMKAGDGNVKESNLLLAMANTLSLRGDNYAAEGYYDDLISRLNTQIAEKGLVLPQSGQEDKDLVTTYLYAANNYGVTLYRLASRTGNSSLNAAAIVQLSQSLRAWDALTRNQETMVRLGGSNLAEQNIRYITHAIPDFEPAIYTEIPQVLVNSEKL